MMRRYWAYFKSVCYHKWLVFIAGYKLQIPLWILITHDLSKFHPSEFFAYARALCTHEGRSTYIDSLEFDYAWLYHQNANKHHWQYWISIDDLGTITPLEIPIVYVNEMIADWLAMEISNPNSLSAGSYFKKIRNSIYLHPKTRQCIELLLIKYSDFKWTDRSTDLESAIKCD